MPAIDTERSDIRMAVLYKPGMKNITWYSFLRYNGRHPDYIIQKMINNFQKWDKANMNDVQAIQFYNNHNDQLIKKILPEDPLP